MKHKYKGELASSGTLKILDRSHARVISGMECLKEDFVLRRLITNCLNESICDQMIRRLLTKVQMFRCRCQKITRWARNVASKNFWVMHFLSVN